MARTDNLTNYLTDVADAIKEKIGDDTPIPASEFDTKISEIESGGYIKVAINNVSLGRIAKTLYFDLSDVGTSAERIVGMIKATSSANADALIVKEVHLKNTSDIQTFSLFFTWCKLLETVNGLDGSNCKNITDMFYNCYILKNIDGFKDIGKAYETTASANYANYHINLTSTISLTEQSMINILNDLYDIATKGCKTQSVSFGTTNKNRLTSQEGQAALDVAILKGWSVV